MIKNLDIERLHEVSYKLFQYEKQEIGNQAGLTTAIIYAMLGEVWLGDHNQFYVYASPYMEHSKKVCREFVELLLDECIVCQVANHVVYIPMTEQTFKFTSFQDVSSTSSHLRGSVIARAFLDDNTTNAIFVSMSLPMVDVI